MQEQVSAENVRRIIKITFWPTKKPLRQWWRGAAIFYLDIYWAEINLQIIIDPGFDSLRESIFCGIVGFKRINRDSVFLRINNPVFTNSGSTVFEQFSVVIHAPAARGDNLNDPIRRTCATFVCEFVRAAYNAYIRLDIVFIIFIQKYGKWGDIDFTGAAFIQEPPLLSM